MTEEKAHLTINALIDHLQSFKRTDINQAYENLAAFIGLNFPNPERVPEIIQYTRGIGTLVSQVAENDIKSALLFDSSEAFDFVQELHSESGTLENLILIEDELPVSELSFPLCPNGKGWKVVILDDILPAVGGDEQVTQLMRSISGAMDVGGYLIIRLPELKEDSWSKEFNNTVVTESLKKKSMRRFERTITAHGEIDVRFTEDVHNFSAADLHACARDAHFRPNRDMGMDSSIWCCYQKVN
jgi:hypothetical protein